MNEPNKLARAAGLWYLLLAPVGIFGLVYVPTTLIVPEDVSLTISNILANESLYRLGILSALLTQVVNLFVVLALYKLLSPVNKTYAAFMTVFIVCGAPIAMLSEANQLAVLNLLRSDFPVEQIEWLVPHYLALHQHGINIATIFWGLWLFPMGTLIYKSGYLPKVLGVLLMIGCFGYLIDAGIFFLMPDVELTVSQYTFIGELLFPLWLVFKGVNVEQWNRQVLVAAQAQA